MSKEQIDLAATTLTLRLKYLQQYPMTRRTYEMAMEEIKHHRLDCLARGIPFPECVAVVLPPPYNWLHVVRRELTDEEVQALAKTIIMQFPNITGLEVAQCIRRAFPNYRRDLFVNVERSISMKGDDSGGGGLN